MARKMRTVFELHDFGVEMMRRRLVQAHGPVEGEKLLRDWLAADQWQGPGQPGDRRLAER